MFRHGVASGDPETDRVVIWTRVSGRAGLPVPLRWTVARDAHLSDTIARGEVEATADADWTAQVDVDGLLPGTTYWYAFEGPGGELSTVGRTRTLPADPDHVRFAVVSCAKYNAGFFNGYARIAERDDIDFVLHLGDYIYEASQTPPASQTPGADIGRPFDPLGECRTLEEYRLRYAQYRADPDTLALHHAHPLVATLDDHELADGAWRGGAEEHRPERDGPWEARRAACFQARREWLPQRLPNPSDPERVWRSLRLGSLADLLLIDSRSQRDQPVTGPAADDPQRSQLGAEQRAWLLDELAGSRARWRLLANSSVMAQTWIDGESEELRAGLRSLKLNGADGGPDADQWDGYPAERELLLGHMAGRDCIVLSGDVHVALALELRRTGDDPGTEPVAAEFVTASLTSQNLADKRGWGYRSGSLAIEEELRRVVPAVLWCDVDSHGYMVIEVTPEIVSVEWWFVDTVLERSTGHRLAALWQVRHGSSRPRQVAT